jgi:hypothetical protein
MPLLLLLLWFYWIGFNNSLDSSQRTVFLSMSVLQLLINAHD